MNLNHAFISRIWKKQTGAWDMSENVKIYNAMKTVSFSLESMKKIHIKITDSKLIWAKLASRLFSYVQFYMLKNTVGS